MFGYKDFNLPNGKAPPPKGWQKIAGNDQLSETGWRGRSTENFFVLDIDNPELIDRAMRKFKERITTIVETPSGGKHLYFGGVARNQQRDGYDVRSDGGYVCVPPSPGYRYETPLVPVEYLRPFPPELLKKPETKTEQLPELEGFRRINRARAYSMTISCVAGQKAHNTFFRLVCWMRDIGLTQAEAYAVILDWNMKNCTSPDGSPYPWSTREIEHKLSDAYARVT